MHTSHPSGNRFRGTVCAISDSLTNDDPGNWLGLLAAGAPGLRVVAEAHGGWTTRSYFKTKKFGRLLFARVPADTDLFILLLGSNNLFEAEGGSDAAVEEACRGIVRVAKRALRLSPGAEVMLAAPPTVALKNVERYDGPKPKRRIDSQSPFYLEKLSRSYRKLAMKQGWYFVDLFPVLNDRDFVDGAHPGPGGAAMAGRHSVQPRHLGRLPRDGH